jgi:hypothetical protein
MALEVSNKIGHVLSQSTGILKGKEAAPQQAGGLTDAYPQATDAVELSTQLRDIQNTHRILQEAPEVREDLVAKARDALIANELTLEGEALAEKLISEQLSRD